MSGQPGRINCLILGSSELDLINRNYYGESSLFFMRADGTLECKV